MRLPTLLQLQASIQTPKDAVIFLQNRGLLMHNNNICSHCRSSMNLQDFTCADDCRWRCNCQKTSVSVRFASWFNNSKLSLSTFIYYFYFWSTGLGTKYIMDYLGLSSSVCARINKFLRTICARKIASSDMSIGGSQHIIEIDETIISKKESIIKEPINQSYGFLVGSIGRLANGSGRSLQNATVKLY